MSFCPNCGNNLPETARFCAVCGQPVQIQTPQPQPVQLQQPTYVQPPQYTQPQYAQPQPSAPYTQYAQSTPQNGDNFLAEVGNIQSRRSIVSIISTAIFAIAIVLVFVVVFKLQNWAALKESDDWRDLADFLEQSKNISDSALKLVYISGVLFIIQLLVSNLYGLMTTKQIQNLVPQNPDFVRYAQQRLTTRPSKLNALSVERDPLLFQITTCALVHENPMVQTRNIILVLCVTVLQTLSYVFFMNWGAANVQLFIDSNLWEVTEFAWDWSSFIIAVIFFISTCAINITSNIIHSKACQQWFDARFPKNVA